MSSTAVVCRAMALIASSCAALRCSFEYSLAFCSAIDAWVENSVSRSMVSVSKKSSWSLWQSSTPTTSSRTISGTASSDWVLGIDIM